jgi:phage tail sheath protein FI
MPEYLAPGVFVEETSFRAKAITGVGTSTCALLGPTRSGPPGEGSDDAPEVLTSFAAFERVHGGLSDLQFAGGTVPNYVAHAARAFFQEGGRRLHVVRVVASARGAGMDAATTATALLAGGEAPVAVAFEARFPGAAGNGRVRVVEQATPATRALLDAAPEGTWLRTGSGDAVADHLKAGRAWHAVDAAQGPAIDTDALAAAQPRILSLAVHVRDADGRELGWTGLGYDRRHPQWIGAVLAPTPARREQRLEHPFALRCGAQVDAAGLRRALLADAQDDAQGRPALDWTLAGGSDGSAPLAADYAAALRRIAALDDVSMVAAPGAVAMGDHANAAAVMQALVDHASAPRAWRIAVLDPPPDLDIGAVRALRSRFDSAHAALYYPWVVVNDPQAGPGTTRELQLPPSGFLCGIYARSDIERGVHKAPANESVRSALRFAAVVSQAQQEVLNPEGINCLRFFEGRGHRVWGARTLSADPEWKYLNVRRYFDYLEASLQRGTQWAVFEPNGERLWANLVQCIGDFLYNEWRNGALLGNKPEQAYFIRCDRSTMAQHDLDNGRVVCQVGVAMLRPAEFTILRIGHATATG